jgi:hypothetical protein
MDPIISRLEALRLQADRLVGVAWQTRRPDDAAAAAQAAAAVRREAAAAQQAGIDACLVCGFSHSPARKAGEWDCHGCGGN